MVKGHELGLSELRDNHVDERLPKTMVLLRFHTD